MMRGPLRLTFLLLSVALTSCGPSEHDRIEAAIKAHLSQVAPDGLQPNSWDDVVVDVVEARPDGETGTEVRFQAFDPRDVTSPADSMRGPIHSVYLERTDDGLRVRRYGESLARSVAIMVAADRRLRYRDLLEATETLRDTARAAISGWARPLRSEFDAAGSEAERDEITRVMAARVPAAVLSAGIEARWDPPEGLEWGVIDEHAEDGAEVLYVRVRARPDEVCAYQLPQAAPDSWSWLRGQHITCRGRGGLYVEEYPPETILEEIQDRGGILQPSA